MTKSAFVSYGLSDYSSEALDVIFDVLDDSFKDDYSDDELPFAFSCIKDCFTEVSRSCIDDVIDCKDECSCFWELNDTVLFEHLHN